MTDEGGEQMPMFGDRPKEHLTLTEEAFVSAIAAHLGNTKLARALRDIPLKKNEAGNLTRETFGNIYSLTLAWTTQTPDENIRATYQEFLDFLKMHHPRWEDAK